MLSSSLFSRMSGSMPTNENASLSFANCLGGGGYHVI